MRASLALLFAFSSLVLATEHSGSSPKQSSPESASSSQWANRFNQTIDHFKRQLEDVKDAYKHQSPEIFNRTLSAVDHTVTSLANFVKAQLNNSNHSTISASFLSTATPTTTPTTPSNEAVPAWNPGGQGEGFGEPARSKTGGDFRYTAGRGRDDSKDWQTSYAGSHSPTQGASQDTPHNPPQSPPQSSPDSPSQSFDWQKYAGQTFDWHKYAGGQGGGERAGEGGAGVSDEKSQSPESTTEQRLMFNVTVTGRDVEVVSSFGVGGGRGGADEEGQGGGGGGQHRLRLKRGRVEFRGGFDGETVTSKHIVLA